MNKIENAEITETTETTETAEKAVPTLKIEKVSLKTGLRGGIHDSDRGGSRSSTGSRGGRWA